MCRQTHVTVGASRKFCLNFTISWFEIRVNRPNSFMVYNYLFGVVCLTILFTGFVRFKDDFVAGQNNCNDIGYLLDITFRNDFNIN